MKIFESNNIMPIILQNAFHKVKSQQLPFDLPIRYKTFSNQELLQHYSRSSAENFWANNDGSGMVRFREIGASWLKSFNADFGTNIVHQFMIGGAQSISSSSNLNTWKIFPTPTKNIITVEGSTNEDVQVWITDNLGKIILRKKFTKMVSLSETIDISHLKNGVYLLNIISSKEKIVKKIVKQ